MLRTLKDVTLYSCASRPVFHPLQIFKMPPRSIVQVAKLVLLCWMLFSCLIFVEMIRSRQNYSTPTNCVITMDQWYLKGIWKPKRTPQKVCIGELFQTAEINSKRTTFQTEFRQNDIISVFSLIPFEVYQGPNPA